jgi:shikimate kinase
MMGAGKTTVGLRLARRLNRPYVDSDAQVEAATGRTVREIFEADGEDAFRVHEARALAEAVSCAEPSVVAVAGGAVLDGRNRRLIESAGTVVWLRAPVSVLAGRVRTDDHRPLLGDDPAAAIDRLYEVRQPIYERLADVIIDVDAVAPDGVVEQILGAM